MGQGWKTGENEIGVIVTQLGDGNLVDKQPADVGLGTALGATPLTSIPVTPDGVDLVQMAADIAAIKVKLGM